MTTDMKLKHYRLDEEGQEQLSYLVKTFQWPESKIIRHAVQWFYDSVKEMGPANAIVKLLKK